MPRVGGRQRRTSYTKEQNSVIPRPSDLTRWLRPRFAGNGGRGEPWTDPIAASDFRPAPQTFSPSSGSDRAGARSRCACRPGRRCGCLRCSRPSTGRPPRRRRRVVPNDPRDREAHREPQPFRWASPRFVAARHHVTKLGLDSLTSHPPLLLQIDGDILAVWTSPASMSRPRSRASTTKLGPRRTSWRVGTGPADGGPVRPVVTSWSPARPCLTSWGTAP